MLINIINKNAEQELLSLLEQVTDNVALRRILHFKCSKLKHALSEEEVLLTVRPVLEDRQAAIYFFHDGDIVITWNGAQKLVFETLRTRLYQRFYPTGTEVLHTYYDAEADGEKLRLICKHKMADAGYYPADESIISLESTKPTQFLQPSEMQIKIFRALAATRKQRKKIEVLIVEDQPFSSKLLVSVLERICKTYSALNAEKAMELYLNHAPDIVFMDIEMPGINGHDLAAAIRQLDEDANIIMVTANNYIEDVARAKKNGTKGFVVKPYSKQKILECIKKFSSSR